jgi:microcystin-dependent protein
MSSPYIGEVQLFGFNFNPRGWAFCNGATLPIQQNTALFALIGVTYGGNGQTTFQLPNLAGRAACEQGVGPGLSARSLGETFGTNTVALTSQQMPLHTHALNGFSQPDPSLRSGAPVANGGLSILTGSPTARTFAAGPPNTQLAPNMIAPNPGGGFAHENQQPYLGMNFCIALQGIFPSFP